MKEPAGNFSWQEEDNQSAGGSQPKGLFCSSPKPGSNTSTSMPVLSSIRARAVTRCQLGLFWREQQGNSQGTERQVHQVHILDHQQVLW